MQVKEIKLAEIATSPLNPRKSFDETALNELAQSIEQNGLIQPITIRKKKGENGTKYEIVCGECRYRAHLILKRETIEATVKELDDKQAFACMVIENLQRKDIDPLEEASALKQLYSKGEVPVKEIAKMLGKSVSFVVNRIQLNNIIQPFVDLLRDGTLNLLHLQEIAKLTHDQQQTLWQMCFQPANIEQWDFKTLKMEMLKDWIDANVMGAISAARFDPTDTTYKSCGKCKACEKCKFNTATYPSRFKDTDNPRCMNMANYHARNREAVLRQAKELGCQTIYVGTAEENKEIIEAANELLLYPQSLGKREYLVEPVAPSPESFSDPERFKKRMANYERVRAVFDENIASGLVMKVYEISYKGVLNGEVKYLYNLEANENGEVEQEEGIKHEQLSQYKMELRSIDEQRRADRVERQRQFMESSEYSQRDGQIDATEESVFIALLASRLSPEFRKTLGINGAEDVNAMLSNLTSHKDAIIREYMRMLLSDKSVGYSDTFASLLDLTLCNSNKEDVQNIDRALKEDYEAKCRSYEELIAELEAQLKKEDKEATADAPESQTEVPTETPTETPVVETEKAEAVA